MGPYRANPGPGGRVKEGDPGKSPGLPRPDATLGLDFGADCRPYRAQHAGIAHSPDGAMWRVILCHQRTGNVQSSKSNLEILGDCWNFFQVTC